MVFHCYIVRVVASIATRMLLLLLLLLNISTSDHRGSIEEK
jgi:hypothetical protein